MKDFEDIFIYIPGEKKIIGIAKGSGENLDKEDRNSGYEECIEYDIHNLEAELPIEDGGVILLSREDIEMDAEGCIGKVLEFIYGINNIRYVMLN